MTRVVSAPEAEICYELTRKRVKNINLRLAEDGAVRVSAPGRVSAEQVDAFVRSKAGWILRHQQAMARRPVREQARYTVAECLAIFTAVSDGIFPLFADLLGGEKPTLKVREMKTRWGVCNIQRRSITLNSRLAEKPLAAIEYVVLHEYVHFLHPNHQQGFHSEMARLMPDYKERRGLLR